jgi:hypothetical protein
MASFVASHTSSSCFHGIFSSNRDVFLKNHFKTLTILKKYKNLLWFLLIIACFIIFISIKVVRDRNSLNKKFKIVAVIINEVKIHKGVYFLQYSFLTNKTTITGKTRLAVGNTNLTYLSNVFVGQKILLAIDFTNESNNVLLLSRQDYKRFRINPSGSIIAIFEKIDSLRLTKFN